MDPSGDGPARHYQGAHASRDTRRTLLLCALAIVVLVGAVIVLKTRATPPVSAATAAVPSGPGSPPSVGAPSGPASPSPSTSRTSPTPSASPSGPTLPPPTTRPAVTGRKGVSVWTFDGVDKALADSGSRWYYTWSTGHSGISTPPGVDFVPMIWGPGSVTTSSLHQAESAGRELLGFNEPDLASQSNMSVSQALDLWPKLMATGLTLGSPAVASGGATPGGWLDQFMTGAAKRGYRVDFITLHWYGSDFDTTAAVSQLKSYIQAVYARYHKPIWLTEFALIDFSNGTSYPPPPRQAAFLSAATTMLDGLPYLTRYAWFALPASDSGPSTGLYRSGPEITKVGNAFKAAR